GRVPRRAGLHPVLGRVAGLLRARARGARHDRERHGGERSMIRARARGRRWTETRGSISARGLVPFLDTLFNLLFALLAMNVARAPAAFDLLSLHLPRVEPGQDEGAPAARGIVLAVGADGSVRPEGADAIQ